MTDNNLYYKRPVPLLHSENFYYVSLKCVKILPLNGDAPQCYSLRLRERYLPTGVGVGQYHQSLLNNCFASFTVNVSL